MQYILKVDLFSKENKLEFTLMSKRFLERARNKEMSAFIRQYEDIFLKRICESSLPIDTSMLNILFTHITHILPRRLKKEHSDSTFFLSVGIKQMDRIELMRMEEGSKLKAKGLVVACLKYGLNVDYKDELSTLCLRLVKQFLNSKQQISSEDSNVTLFTPGQIFTMITSHSHFVALASQKASNRREELISLLISCLNLDDDISETAVNAVIKQLMKGFDAALNKSAILLRRLLIVSEEKFDHDKVSEIKSLRESLFFSP